MEIVKVVMLYAVVVVAVAAALSEATIRYDAETMLEGSYKAIFLLAGQSNMAGRGGTRFNPNRWDEQTPPMCQPDRRILRLNNEERWEEAREPLHRSISFARCLTNDSSSGVGPGMPFANTLLAIHPAIGTIGLVPCAVGNTNIFEWSRGGCLIYNRLITRARASPRDGESLRGMLWYQGENDCRLKLADTYKDKLKAFFNDIRKDLMMPSLPIIQVALDLPESDPNVKKIRIAQLNLKLPNLRSVDALGLPVIKRDNVHLTTDSQVTLGSKLAQEYVKYFI